MAALMVRLYALHSFIAKTFLFGPNGPQETVFSLSAMVESMPLLLFLQVRGLCAYEYRGTDLD